MARLLDGSDEGKLDLQLELGDNSPEAEFVFDYHMMDNPSEPEMEAYFKKAFKEVLEYHDRYSHYAKAG